MTKRQKTAAPKFDETTQTWWFVVDIEPGPDGKRRQAKRRGFPTLKAAKDELARLQVKVQQGVYVAPKRQTLERFLLDDWLPAIEVKLAESTVDSYRNYLTRHVVPAIGQVQLQQLDGPRLSQLYARLLSSGRKDGRGGLSPRTTRYIHTIIHAALDDAVRWDRIQVNAADKADPPSASSAESPEMKTWDAATLARFLQLTRSDRLHTAWLFLATTGCRRGEALGLRWGDLNLETGRAAIRQQVTLVGHTIVTKSRTKTGKARLIDLDAGTVAALTAWKARQNQERLLLGAGYDVERDLVFCRPDGGPLHPDRFSREFDRRIERHKLPRIRIHDLRHSWATLALEQGIHPKVVQERLGHTKIGITLDIYSHATPAMKSDAAERVAGLIFGA